MKKGIVESVRKAAREAIDQYVSIHPATSVLIHGPTGQYYQQFVMIAQFAKLWHDGNRGNVTFLPAFAKLGLSAVDLQVALSRILFDEPIMAISVEQDSSTGELLMTGYTRRCGIHQGLARSYGANGIPGFIPPEFIAAIANRGASQPAVDDEINVVYMNQPYAQRKLFSNLCRKASDVAVGKS